MSLVAQFDKIVVLSKRLSSMTDDKTGKTREFRFVTGFDAVSGSVFSDLSLSDDSPIQFNDIWDNRVYNGQFTYSNVNDGKNERSFLLNHPSKALLLPAGVWEELRNFSSGAVALVLASIPYTPEDYIRDFDEFLKYKQQE